MLAFRSPAATTAVALTSLGVLAGCQAGEVMESAATMETDTVEANAAETASTEAPDTEMAESTDEAAEAASASFADGTYEATGGYQSPNGPETVTVSITIAGGEVAEVVVTPEATNSTSQRYQGLFAGGIAQEIVGVPINELQVTRVAGSSLTQGGFNQALEQIRAQAKTG
jgi:uncharacterized protein with FMN-binding domain